MYLSTKNLNLPKSGAKKLCPKFVGPWKVIKAWPEMLTYELELPMALWELRIHPIFHVSLLFPYNASNDMLFPNYMQPELYDFGAMDDQEWFIDKIISHQWKGQNLTLEVRWSLGDTTQEPLENWKNLMALDRYLELQGIRHSAQLVKRC